MEMMSETSHVCKLIFLTLHYLNVFKKGLVLMLFFVWTIAGSDELVKSLIFDAMVTNDFENQKSPKPRGESVA